MHGSTKCTNSDILHYQVHVLKHGRILTSVSMPTHGSNISAHPTKTPINQTHPPHQSYEGSNNSDMHGLTECTISSIFGYSLACRLNFWNWWELTSNRQLEIHHEWILGGLLSLKAVVITTFSSPLPLWWGGGRPLENHVIFLTQNSA